MFETLDFPKSLDEDQFDDWLEKGRNSALGYHFLIIVWNSWDEDFKPVYKETRESLTDYINHLSSQEVYIATYDLYSESRIQLDA